MKTKLTLIAIFLMTMVTARAGDGDKHVGIQAGILYPGMVNATFSVDAVTKYHNAWEVYIDAFTKWEKCPDCGEVCKESFWKSQYGLGIGAAYKPTVHRSRNSVGRARVGLDVGTNTRAFALGVEIGYEYVWTFSNNVQFVLQQKNEVTFWGGPTWRFGGLVGIRLPI